MKQTPGFVGARLREAREVRGLSAVALAEIVGVSAPSISQYEHGKSSPSQQTLHAIATKLNLPEYFFLKPERIGSSGQKFFRSMSSATKSARVRAERRFEWLRDIVAYVSEFVELPPSNIPKLNLPDDPLLLADDEIEDAAEQVRRYWRMSDGPVGNMVSLLENQGVVVARDKLGAETLDGLSEFVPDEQRPYVIIGTDKGTPARWRFDAAHELAHMVLHTSLDKRLLGRPEYFKRVEAQAHRFAAAFLLPLAPFGDDLFAVNLDTLRSIKPKWGVSIAMMVVRARHAGFISEEAERRLWINLSRRGWRRHEPYDDAMTLEEPRLLRRALELVLASHAQTPQDVLSSVALSSTDIERLCRLQPGYLMADFTPVSLLEPRPAEATDEMRAPAEVIPFRLRPRTS